MATAGTAHVRQAGGRAGGNSKKKKKTSPSPCMSSCHLQLSSFFLSFPFPFISVSQLKAEFKDVFLFVGQLASAFTLATNSFQWSCSPDRQPSSYGTLGALHHQAVPCNVARQSHFPSCIWNLCNVSENIRQFRTLTRFFLGRFKFPD